MNKKFTTILIPLMLLTVGCSNPSNTSSSTSEPTSDVVIDKAFKNQLIDKLIDNVYVDATIHQKVFYGEEYPQLNFDTTDTLRNHYVVLHNDDGTETNTVTVYNDYGSLTYFENKQGLADYEVLNTKNEVVMLPYHYMNKHVRYVELFENPFTYLDHFDIDNELNLSSEKTNFILKTLFGVEVNVSSSKFVFENNALKGLDIVVSDKTVFKENYDGTSVSAAIETEITFALNTEFGELVRLTANTEAHDDLAAAFAKMDNSTYVIEIESDSLEADVLIYNTDDVIYLHRDHRVSEPVHNDYLFVKNKGTDTYQGYVYSIDDVAFLPLEGTHKKDIVLATFSAVKTELFDLNNGLYKLDYAAAKFNAELLIPAPLNSYPGTSYEATVKVTDGQIEYCDIVNGAGYDIKQTFTDVGSATLPTWLNISL